MIPARVLGANNRGTEERADNEGTEEAEDTDEVS